MDAGSHLFVGVLTASYWPNLTLEQKIATVLFALIPDSFEWLHQYARKAKDADNNLGPKDYNHLEIQINGWILLPYNLLHNIFTPLIFLGFSIVYGWSLVFSLMWLGHLLLDLPSHKLKLGLKLFWPFSKKRLKGFFDWWLLPFFQGWELLGYWAIISVISYILIKNFW